MRFQRSAALFAAAMGLVPTASGLAAAGAPYSGVPFYQNAPLGVQPNYAQDGANTEMVINRLLIKGKDDIKYVSPHACDLGDQADKVKCLGTKGRGCMWTSVTTKDPLKRVQESNNFCLPCELDGENIPCWNTGAWVNGKQVTDCKMSCSHQERIWQPEYACSDVSGFISQSQCFSRGATTGSKCMYLAFEDEKGEQKGTCGPCALTGSGNWGCPSHGDPGPEAGTKIISCMSQCDVLCAGPPACPPTVAPPPPPPPPSPGIVKVSLDDPQKMISAPAPFAGTTPNPYAMGMAIEAAARKAGWKIGTPPPPKTYWPVIYYRQPLDYLFTTGPPPNTGPEPPSGIGLLQSKEKPNLLRSLRRRK